MSVVSNTSTDNTPQITVLMSVFNGERWLAEAIESVLNQSFKKFEFIIVDDGSTDASADILNRYKSIDDRIVVISKVNTGLADSLNHGIQKARGDWIARLDADDICEPTRLEKQINVATSNAKLVYIGTGLTIINEVGEKGEVHLYPSKHTRLLRNLVTFKKFPAHSSAFYQTRIVRAVGGYRVRIKRAQDWDLWLRLSAKGEMTALTEPLVLLRHHNAQISHDEEGNRQLFDSRMGLVSYWIRNSGVADPVDADEESFQLFTSWLKDRLIEEHFFQLHGHMAMLRSHISAASNSPMSRVKLIVYCLQHPIVILRFIKERLLGDSLARRLSLEWVRLQ